MILKHSLKNICSRPDCKAVAWHVNGRQYLFQINEGYSDKDKEAMSEVEEEVILRVDKGIYILRNSFGLTEEDGPTATINEIKKMINSDLNN